MSVSSGFSHPVSVEALPEQGMDLEVSASLEECRLLAQYLDVPEVKNVRAVLHLHPYSKGGVRMTGQVLACLTQVCGVSLEEFETTLDNAIDVSFAPASQIDPDDEEAPDPIYDGIIDVGQVVSEELSLGLDPYPRKPGVSFEGYEEDRLLSPFAQLAQLKGPSS